MKSLTKIMSVCALGVCCVFGFAACGGPAHWSKAELAVPSANPLTPGTYAVAQDKNSTDIKITGTIPYYADKAVSGNPAGNVFGIKFNVPEGITDFTGIEVTTEKKAEYGGDSKGYCTYKVGTEANVAGVYYVTLASLIEGTAEDGQYILFEHSTTQDINKGKTTFKVKWNKEDKATTYTIDYSKATLAAAPQNA